LLENVGGICFSQSVFSSIFVYYLNLHHTAIIWYSR